MLHRRTHPQPVDGCFGCHVATIGVAAAALPNRGKAITVANQKDAALARDMDAYKRLRRDGEQPARIDGAAHVEKHAETRLEVSRSLVLNDRQRRQVETLRKDGVSL
jgi:hypothetical protein